ncbi:MAG: Dabb family protein [Methanomassiliicoccales archaeon]|nr:Dabb family protein [Methanomassiliicoccales archaeon]
MIRHVVLWRLKEQAEGRSRLENAKMIKVHLEALPDLVPEIRRLEVGADVLNEGSSWDLCLIVEFDDLEALKRYQDHPEHKRVAELVALTRDQRAVVDYMV